MYHRFMRWLVVMAVLLWASMTSAAPAWTIDPPAGWHEDAAAAAQLRRTWAGAAYVQRSDTHVWTSARNSALLVLWVQLRTSSDTLSEVDQFDRGTIKGFVGSDNWSEQAARSVDGMIIRDGVAEKLRGVELHAHAVRRYQSARDGVHALITMCMGASEAIACDAAMESARLQVDGPVPFPQHEIHDAYYTAGYMIGYLIGPGILVLAGWLVYRIATRRRRLLAANPQQRGPMMPP
jgi:hypothetical protein